MPRNILIIDGHPAEHSLSGLFCDTYAKTAENAGHSVRMHRLSQMTFDADFGDGGYEAPKPLEPDLQSFLDDLVWCDHVVLASPLWWGGFPAKLKGVLDRALLPGVTFDTQNHNAIGMPKPMLSDRTARVIVTSDTPYWFFRFVYGKGLINQTRHQVMGFIGIKPTKFTWFSGATDADKPKIKTWVQKIEAIAKSAS